MPARLNRGLLQLRLARLPDRIGGFNHAFHSPDIMHSHDVRPVYDRGGYRSGGCKLGALGVLPL